MAANVIVVSHRRSGTHLTIDAIRNNFPDYRAEFANVDELQDSSDVDLALKMVASPESGSARVMKTHSPVEVSAFFRVAEVGEIVRDGIEKSKIIYVHRDGRDVMTSFFHYVRDVKPPLQSINFSRFLRMADPLGKRPSHPALGNVEYWQHHVSGWLERPDILPVAFESLVLGFDNEIRRIATFLEQPLPESITRVVRHRDNGTLPSGLWNRTREKLTKLYLWAVRGVDLTTVHFRQGKIGSYEEVFSGADLRYFHEVAERAMTQLGYTAATNVSSRSQ